MPRLLLLLLQFLHEHVRMRDVRLYLRDVLQEYAALQQFQPYPHPQAVCYTGGRLQLAPHLPRNTLRPLAVTESHP